MSEANRDAGGSILPLATRDHPVDWHSLMRDALAPLDLSLSPSVESTLDALTTYAASGPSDPTSFVALLLSLHAATWQWPFAVRAALRPPPVRVGAASVAVSGAAMEAFVVLYNAAVVHFDAGVAAMSRVRADDTATARAGRGTNGKAAYKSFGEASRLAAQAQALATGGAGDGGGPSCGGAVGGEGDGPAVLAPADRCVAQQHFDLRALRELTELCRAVAKYVFSTASGAVSTRHSALARLAHCAALLPHPPGAFAESLRQLPTVLLAACHKHRAQFFYQELSNRDATPEMERVLGHIAYAYRLLDDMQREAAAAAAASASAARAQRSSGGGWGILGRLSATLTGKANNGGDNEDDNNNNNSGDADDTGEPFARLATLFAGTHLMRVFPLLTSLARDVAQLSAKYAHENESVYMVRAMREHDVAADVPDADPIAADVAAPSVPFAFSSSFISGSSGSSGPFGELPAAAEVRDRAERAAGLRDAVAQLRAVLDAPPPARCLAAAQRLTPLLRGHNNTHNNNNINPHSHSSHSLHCGPVDIAGAVRSAFSDAEAAVTQHEAVSAGLRQVKSAYIGNHVGSAAETVALRRRVSALSRSVTSAAAMAETALPHAADCDTLQDAMLPSGPLLRRALRAARTALDENNNDEGGEKEVAEARAALRLAKDALADGHWDRVARALDAAADALEEARAISTAAEEATALLERERARVVVTPLRRVTDAQFGAKAAAAPSSARGRRRRRSEERTSPRRGRRRSGSSSSESREGGNKSSESSESDGSSESDEEAERQTRRGRSSGAVRGVKQQPRRAVQRRGSSSNNNKKDKDKDKEKEKEKGGKAEVGATVATVSKSLLRRLRDQKSPSDESSATEEEREEVKEAKRRKPAPRRRRGS